MRAPLAWAAVRRSADVQAFARERDLCSTLSFERRRQEKRHGNGARLARIWSICDTAAASFRAQQWVVEKESVVRSRAYPATARPRGASALFRALALVFAALTTACAPRLAAEGPEMRMPAIERDNGMGAAAERYVTRDGLRLGLTHWDAPTPFAAIVALHGMSDYSNAFAIPAPWWAEHGITTYAYDQRGFGRSPQLGIWPGNNVLRRDLADFVDIVRARHPGLPVFVLGESMGGAVAMTAFASDEPPKADGLILVAPAVWSRRTMPVSYRVALWVTSRSFRWWPLSGSGLKIMPSDNIPMLIAIGRDPLFQKRARADAIYGLVSLMDEAYDSPARLNRLPIMLAYGGNDQIIPKRPTDEVVAKLGPNATVKRYPQGYHMLLRDLDGGTRWADIALWVGAQAQKRMGPAMASR
jgi:acylglycerol lipase